MKNHGNQPKTMKNHENTLKTMETIITTLDWDKQKRDSCGVTTDLGGGRGRNKQKRHLGGVTTDLGGGGAGISKNVT